MIGRFLGSDVPATGFSLGFERLVDLVEMEAATDALAIALVHEAGADAALLATLKTQLIAEGYRVRLVRRVKNVKLLFDALAADGFSHFAFITDSTTSAADLDRRPLGD